jgi:clan AA aspartic protease
MTFGKKEENMGLVYAEISLTSEEDLSMVRKHLMDQDEVRKMNISCLVDSGAYPLCINENIQEYLQLPFMYKKESQTADGRWVESDVVGPVHVEFEGLICSCPALVLPGGSEPLLGAIPMEMLDLIISPFEQKVVLNLASKRHQPLQYRWQ